LRCAVVALALASLAGCGSTQADGAATGSAGSAVASGSPATTVPQLAEIAALPLGVTELAGYGWRQRAGQRAFRAARKAERRDDWATVRTECTAALAADPTNLEAAWLLAAADGALDLQGELLAPLSRAVAGDFGKWADASLAVPQLKAWLATTTGQAWRRRVDADRARYADALSRSVVVASGGDLYAFDPAPGGRWNRLTRTYGGVVGALALPDGHRVAYVARARDEVAWYEALGIVDLATGHATRPVSLKTSAPVVVEAWGTESVWVQSASGKPTSWRIDGDGKLAPLPPPPYPPRNAGPTSLRVSYHAARLDRRANDITADFDDRGLASQIRLDTSKRVVSVPSPGQIDGSSIAWSPDHVHLALIAQLEDRCQVGARVAVAAYVVDAATGVLRIVERASGGLAVEWLADGRLAVAGDHGVSVYDLAHLDKPALVLPGATDLVTPRRVPRCVPADEDVGSAGTGVDEDVE
jgi:hypothetical protein